MAKAMAAELQNRRSGSSRLIGWPMLLVAIWLATGLVLNASAVWLYQSFWILAAPIFIVHAVLGLSLAGLYLLRVLKKEGRQFVLALCAMLFLLPALALLSMSPILIGVGDHVVFALRKADYSRVVADIEAGRYPEPLPWSQDNRLGGYTYDSADPALIVFRWFNGVPDGGSAIVYDPTDSVMQQQANGSGAIMPRLEHLLTGDGVVCKDFAEPHYLMCYFN